MRKIVLAVVALVALTGCDVFKPKKEASQEPQQAQNLGSLTRNFQLIDVNDGRVYGTVEMDPVTGGRVLDSSGRLIGNIVSPTR
jgi:hypothetical protein